MEGSSYRSYPSSSHSSYSEDISQRIIQGTEDVVMTRRIKAQAKLIQETKGFSKKKCSENITFVKERWSAITTWMKNKEERISKVRKSVSNYPEMLDGEQKQVNAECKDLFVKFHTDLSIPFPSDQIQKEFMVHPKVLNLIAEILSNIKIEADKEAGQRKAVRMTDTKEEHIAIARRLLEYLLGDGDFPLELLTNERSLKYTSTGRCLVSDVISSAVSSKRISLDNFYVGDIEGRDPFDAMVADAVNEAVMNYQESLEAPRGGSARGFAAQEANLDRLFHVCWVFRNCSWDDFEDCLKRIKLNCSRAIGDKKMGAWMKGSPSLNMRKAAEELDGIGKGDERSHKYQHPLMITVKRLMNGLCGFIPLYMPGTILNILPASGPEASVIIAIQHIIDVHTSTRAKERSSMWMLMQYLKNCSDVFMYTGMKRGNAMSVRLTPGQDSEIRLSPALVSAMRSVAVNASATDTNLMQGIGIGYLDIDCPPSYLMTESMKGGYAAAGGQRKKEAFSEDNLMVITDPGTKVETNTKVPLVMFEADELAKEIKRVKYSIFNASLDEEMVADVARLIIGSYAKEMEGKAGKPPAKLSQKYRSVLAECDKALGKVKKETGVDTEPLSKQLISSVNSISEGNDIAGIVMIFDSKVDEWATKAKPEFAGWAEKTVEQFRLSAKATVEDRE